MKVEKQANKKALIGLWSMTLVIMVGVALVFNIKQTYETEEIKKQLKSNKDKIQEIKKQQDFLKEELDDISETVSVGLFSTLDFVEVEETSSTSIEPEFEALVNATWRLETGNGKSKLWTELNNAGGIKDFYTGEYVRYQNKNEGIEALRMLLKDKYVKQYGYDLKAIRNEYCYKCGTSDLNVFKELYEEELHDPIILPGN